MFAQPQERHLTRSTYFFKDLALWSQEPERAFDSVEFHIRHDWCAVIIHETVDSHKVFEVVGKVHGDLEATIEAANF